MFDMVKQWFWYDWLMFMIRLICSTSLLLTTVERAAYFTLPLWVLVFWQIIAFSVPWLCLQLNYKSYLLTEIVISGGLCLYLASYFPEAYLTFLVYAFFIAANSAQRAYLWSGPISVLFIPAIIKWLTEQSDFWLMTIHVGLAYVIGFSFHLLMVNHRQSEIIREQNGVLEQYLSQVERITLAEERSRLSKELHDTVGHAYTSLIMGLETLRPELASETGMERLDSMLNLARQNMEEVRGYVHQIESPQEALPLIQYLRKLVEEFQEHARVSVRFQTFGEEYPVTKQVKIALYRCLQESLTNAVRHGHATEIAVSMKFEPQQTRLEIQDNGRGMEQVQDGFGLNAMKERALNLQGHVAVYTQLGEGTLVTCTLPRQTELKDEVIRLLVVDDQPFIRESLRTLLEEQQDLQVVGTAKDGEQAIALCKQVQPQLVLMDLDMPNMDGITASRTMKQMWPHLRILILTTFEDTRQALEALRSGADGYLLKSIKPAELAETIRTVYRGGTLIDQEMSHKLFAQLEADKTGDDTSPTQMGAAYDLTLREIEVLKFVSKGLRYKTIASKLYLSDGTVRNYASSAYMKLGVRNREEALQKALEAGLLE
ncbi:hybrid sensor histidine kinase/response regulator transcription factor [Paenibacillus sp. PL91]|uniref:helix-turn-helix transcriptional regulator n=1 Tax=Paenibacillus sp. PL91 TaxID=2729538 RepID=UPI00145D70B7|nr:hybrid sensor histidine kinase/response regulator transcription factor [Paenibacillus sp. PL91]MBC9204152.1 response regulator [Paenibacillus sp. PL91]